MRKSSCRLVLAGLLCSSAVLVFAGSASAASATLTFKEPEKGSTFAFVDNGPKSAKKHGFPSSISAGDEVIFTNPMEQEGKLVGKVRVACIATQSASSASFTAAHFVCSGVAKIPGGSLIVAAELGNGATEGAITGGTGKYAGARGSFVSKEGKGSSTTTVTLIE